MSIIIPLFLVYFALGFVFGIAFIARGFALIDPAAQGASIILRAMLLPASIFLWPYLLMRWLGASKKTNNNA